jgi:hypothetical protein
MVTIKGCDGLSGIPGGDYAAPPEPIRHQPGFRGSPRTSQSRTSIPTVVNCTSASRRDGREAEGGGLLNLPRFCRFNSTNNLQMGAGALKRGEAASFGTTCSPLCSPGSAMLPQAVLLKTSVRRVKECNGDFSPTNPTPLPRQADSHTAVPNKARNWSELHSLKCINGTPYNCQKCCSQWSLLWT